MIVSEVMNTNVKVIPLDTTIRDAAKKMYEWDIGSLIVVKEQDILGIVTEHDLMKAIAHEVSLDSHVVNIMTKEVATTTPHQSLDEVSKEMAERKIHRMPVLEKEKLIGIITVKDILYYEGQLFDTLQELFFFSRVEDNPQMVAG